MRKVVLSLMMAVMLTACAGTAPMSWSYDLDEKGRIMDTPNNVAIIEGAITNKMAKLGMSEKDARLEAKEFVKKYGLAGMRMKPEDIKERFY